MKYRKGKQVVTHKLEFINYQLMCFPSSVFSWREEILEHKINFNEKKMFSCQKEF